jgi:cyclase
MCPSANFERGLHEVADGVWVYLQPDGGWGWSNAGLVTEGDSSLLVDTLFDLRLTAAMLETMRRTTTAADRIATVVNTHSNGDHWYGNALVSAAEIVTSRTCAEEMKAVPPSVMASLLAAAPGLGDMGAFLQRAFGSFEFEGIESVPATRTFEGSLHLQVGDRPVQLFEVGPAHTGGDVIVHLPDDAVVFTGDILFHGIHPIIWAGPASNWVTACDRLLALDGVETFVPGHGPLAKRSALLDLKGYFDHLMREAEPRYAGGMSPLDAARDIDLGPYSDWGDPERLVVNLTAIYRDLGASVATDPLTMFGQMASFES